MPVLLSAACILFLLLATLIHSQQSETTSRLDFLWKLQANGMSKFLKYYGFFNDESKVFPTSIVENPTRKQ